jgi:hypothetical protein
MSDKGEVRRPKVDPADGQDVNETFLPGQIPVKDADSAQTHRARVTEQQPDPAAAAQAVNPEFLSGVEGDSPGPDDPTITPAEDRTTGER